MATERKRRQYGTGGVSQRESDGRWIGTIEAGWTPRGTRRRLTVSAATEAECRRRLRDKQRQIATDGLPSMDVRSRTSVRTWSGVWLAQVQHRARPRYYATEASVVRRWIVPTIGHKALATLTPADVRAVTGAVRKAGRSTTTAGYAQGTLERMLRAAVVEGHQVPPRVLMVPPPGKAASDRDAIPLEHALALLGAASEREDGARWVAAMLQGMRQGECRGLTWACVDLDGRTLDVSWQAQELPYLDRAAGTFRIPDGYEVRRLVGATHLVRPKSASGTRVIPLVPWMTAALASWRQVAPASPYGLVWPRSDGSPRSSSEDRDAWYALQAAAGVVASRDGRDRYLLHEARHTTATLLLEAGVDVAVVIAIMGHSAITTTRGYQHVSQTLARRALDDVAQRLGLTAG